MTNQFDITKHKWFDATGSCKLGEDRGELWIEFDSKKDPTLLGLNLKDAIAIAKHFNLFDATIYRGDGEIQKLYTFGESTVEYHGPKGVFRHIPQSETTYPNLNLDSVGEIKRHD